MRYFSTLITLFFAIHLVTAAFADDAVTIKIGWTGPLTGNSAVLGIDSVQAARIAVDEANSHGGINGRQIELLVEDDQYDTAKAVTAYNKVVAQGAIAVLSSTYGGVFATAERAGKDKVVVINPLDCNNDIARLTENTFCIATESESIGRVLSEDIVKNKLDPVAVIYDEKNPFMVLVQGVIEKNHNTEPNYYFAGVNQETADYKSLLLRIKSRGAHSIVFLGHDPMGQAMREARALGISAQFYTVGTITSPGYQKLAGDSANGTLVAYWEAPRSNEFENFIKQFQAKVGRPPILELATIPTYDATNILILAIKAAPLVSGRPEISAMKTGLYNLKDYAGLSGKISMDPDGAVRTIRETIYKFDSGKLSLL